MSNYHIDKYKWQYSLDLICPGLRSKDHELYICGSDGIDRTFSGAIVGPVFSTP